MRGGHAVPGGFDSFDSLALPTDRHFTAVRLRATLRMVSGVPVSERLPGYEILEHTADAGVVAHGATMAEAFEHAAEGMYALLVDPGGVRESVERAVDIAASDEPHLLAAWLLELLFLTDSERLLFRRFDVASRTTRCTGERGASRSIRAATTCAATSKA